MRECLGSLAKIHYGKSPNEVAFVDGTIPIVGTGGIYGKASRAMFNEGIVVARKGSLGKPHLFQTPFWPVDTTYAVVPFQGVCIEWLYYCLLDFDLTKLNEATGVPSINRNWLAKITFQNPGSAQQKRVAAVITTIDTAIEQTDALIEKYQHIKAGLMHNLFTRGVLPSGQLRPPRNQAPELYQETAIGWIPREWEITGLASKGRSGTSWIRTGPFGSSLKGKHWRIDGHPVITIGSLGTGEFIASELLFVGSKDATRLLDVQLKTGDVVFSRVADVGRSVVVREAQSGWIMSSNLMRIAVNEAQLRPDYLQMQLAGDWRVKAQIRASVNSGGRDVANSEVLNRLRFAVPELNEQDRIIGVANQLAQRMRAEMRRVAKLQTQKLGLMQDLLTGKVAVKLDSPDNVAAHA